ncbi:DUF3304 domain-containing protein [Collimonas antrihumi]|uniref:DUF3304 domain-containing protein n=1 Tax=Collimonas antrihumi TaxID=1940615 RepID=UPI001B8CFC51|nr:DUF3304 domain-containing protein [Collimonas antrihumi]
MSDRFQYKREKVVALFTRTGQAPVFRDQGFFTKFFFLIACALTLSACHSREEMTGVSISGFGHLGKHAGIPSFSVNGGWGGAANGLGGSGNVCCAMIPDKWRPGIVAHVKWEECDISHIEFKNGRAVDPKAECASNNYEATVPVPEYDEPGTFMVHFFPEHQVAVVVSPVGPRNPSYRWPVMKGYYPSASPTWARARALGIMDKEPYVEDTQ